MYKKIVIIVVSLLIFTGCNNKVEEEKNEYLDTKSILETNTEFTDIDNLPCEITVSLNRKNEEVIDYEVLFNNPKVNMNNVKILVIHNQFTEDVFPYIGLLDSKSKSLIMDSEDNKEIKIKSNLNSTEDIDKLSLEFRIWLEYIDDNEEKNTIFYKTTI